MLFTPITQALFILFILPLYTRAARLHTTRKTEQNFIKCNIQKLMLWANCSATRTLADYLPADLYDLLCMYSA